MDPARERFLGDPVSVMTLLAEGELGETANSSEDSLFLLKCLIKGLFFFEKDSKEPLAFKLIWETVC